MSERSGSWTREILAGHVCEVYEPAVCNESGCALIYLHGVHLESLRDKRPFWELFDRFGFPVLAPQAGPTWWTDRICRAFDEQISAQQFVCEHVVGFARQHWGIEPPRIGLFGTSMGGQGALRLAYRFPSMFPVVAAIAPAIDYQIRYHEADEIIQAMYRDAEDVRQDTATLYVHPLNWPRHQFFCCDPLDLRWIESAERLQMKLQSMGIPHRCDLETAAGGHGFAYYNYMAPTVIRFLVDGLTSLTDTARGDPSEDE